MLACYGSLADHPNCDRRKYRLIAVLAWLAKTFVTSSINKDLERHRSTLAHETERLRHDLHLIAQEHQISFSGLQAKRASVIADIYALIATAHWECSVYVSHQDWTGANSQQELYTTAQCAMDEVFRYVNCNRIYLPESTCAKIDHLVCGMRYQVDSENRYMSYGQTEQRIISEKQLEACMEASQHFNKHVPEARKALETDLRSILGDRVAS